MTMASRAAAQTEQLPLFEIPEDAVQEEPRDFAQDVADVFDSGLVILLRKHRDYGPKNISNSPGGPLNGLRVRLYDKLARLNNLVESGADPQNESLVDTAIDIMNYGAILLMVLEGKWPSE